MNRSSNSMWWMTRMKIPQCLILAQMRIWTTYFHCCNFRMRFSSTLIHCKTRMSLHASLSPSSMDTVSTASRTVHASRKKRQKELIIIKHVMRTLMSSWCHSTYDNHSAIALRQTSVMCLLLFPSTILQRYLTPCQAFPSTPLLSRVCSWLLFRLVFSCECYDYDVNM